MIVYNSCEERRRAEFIRYLKYRIDENKLSFDEICEKEQELSKKHTNLKKELEELEKELIQLEYTKILVIMVEEELSEKDQ